MREMNRAYKNRDEATDVLAFEDGEPDPETGEFYLGDVVVSLETAAREAAARKTAARDEAALYALHGLLHLLGYRDGTAQERAAMEAAQAEIFNRHGLTYREG
jgi:probable rRNA maturation factor